MEVCYKKYDDGERIVYHKDSRRTIHITLGYPIAYMMEEESRDYTINDVCRYGKRFVFDNGKFNEWWDRITRIQNRDEKNIVTWPVSLSKEVREIKEEINETLDHLAG